MAISLAEGLGENLAQAALTCQRALARRASSSRVHLRSSQPSDVLALQWFIRQFDCL